MPMLTPSCGGGDQIGGDALKRWLVDAEAVRSHQGFAGDLDDDASVNRLSHGVPALPICGRPCHGAAEGNARAQPFGRCRHLGGEIGFGTLDTLTERIAHKAGDLDRATDLALGFLQRLRHALLVVVDERLIEQADLLVEGLEP